MRYKRQILMVAGGILTAPALVTSVIHSGDGPTCSTHEMCSLPPAPSGDEPAPNSPHAPPDNSPRNTSSYPKDRYQTEVESWRHLQSDNVEFTIKRLREPIDADNHRG